MFEKRSTGFYCTCDIKLLLCEDMIQSEGVQSVIFGFGPLIIANENGKEIRKTLVLSTSFTTQPSDKIKDGDIVIYHYNKGDLFFAGDSIIKDVTNVEVMFKLLLGGKLPNIIEKNLYATIIKNNILNNEKLDFPDILIEFLLAFLIKDAKDPSKLARVTESEEYMWMNPRNNVMSQSTHAAISFEDLSSAIAASVVRPRGTNIESSIERYSKL